MKIYFAYFLQLLYRAPIEYRNNWVKILQITRNDQNAKIYPVLQEGSTQDLHLLRWQGPGSCNRPIMELSSSPFGNSLWCYQAMMKCETYREKWGPVAPPLTLAGRFYRWIHGYKSTRNLSPCSRSCLHSHTGQHGKNLKFIPTGQPTISQNTEYMWITGKRTSGYLTLVSCKQIWTLADVATHSVITSAAI